QELLLRVVVDDEARDAVARRERRQRVRGKPASVLELFGIDRDLAARVARHEPHHQLARERPVLTADVANVRHVEADLLLHLSRDARLERLAVVDEARDERVAAGSPAGLAGEEAPIAVLHEYDHRGVQVGVVLVATARAALAPLALEALGTLA